MYAAKSRAVYPSRDPGRGVNYENEAWWFLYSPEPWEGVTVL